MMNNIMKYSYLDIANIAKKGNSATGQVKR